MDPCSPSTMSVTLNVVFFKTRKHLKGLILGLLPCKQAEEEGKKPILLCQTPEWPLIRIWHEFVAEALNYMMMSSNYGLTSFKLKRPPPLLFAFVVFCLAAFRFLFIHTCF